MLSSNPSTDPSALLADSQWMRSLASQLVRGDSSVVDDLVQDTLLVALTRTTPPTRAWLGGVMRNLARFRLRSQSRRRDREVFANEERKVPSPDLLSARMEMQRELAEAVLRLREPFRETVLLRFNEDMQPIEIAAHLKISPATVRSRLKRGLDLLREDFDERHGKDGRSWAIALAPLIGDQRAPAPPLTASLPAPFLPIAASLLVAGLVYLGIQLGTGSREAAPIELAKLETPSTARDDARSAVPWTPLDSSRQALARTNNEPSAQGASGFRVHGAVFDAQGQPLASIPIGFRTSKDEEPRAEWQLVGVSGDDGRFEVEVPPTAGTLRLLDDQWTTLLDSTVWPRFEGREAILVGAPTRSFSARIETRAGLGIPGASVGLQLPANFRRDFGQRLSTTNRFRRSQRSDASGHVRWNDLPRVEGAQLLVQAAGYVTRRLDLSKDAPIDQLVVLERIDRPANSRPARVVNEAGEGVGDAIVMGGGRLLRSDDRGFLWVDPPEGDSSTLLRAAAPGYTPGTLNFTAEQAFDELLIPLGGAPTSVRGRVRDSAGLPVEGALVSLGDPTFFGREGDGTPLYGESLSLAQRPFPWPEVRTDEEGRFELAGLADRSYTLTVLGPEFLRTCESGPWHAGEQAVELNLPDFDTVVREGVLRDQEGRPLPGITLWLERTTMEFIYDRPRAANPADIEESVHVREWTGQRIHVIEAQNSSLRRTLGPVLKSDAEGRFRFERAPGSGEVFLRAWGPGWIGGQWLLEERGNPLELTLRQERLVQVVREDSSVDFDRYFAVDAMGERRGLRRSDGDVALFLRSGSFRGSESEIYGLAADALEMVFELDGREVARQHLQPSAEGVTRVRP